MQIVQPYAKMLPPPGLLNRSIDLSFTKENGLTLLRHVEWCARISHRSEEAQTEDSWKRIIQNVVLDHGDWSVTEHASVTVDAYVDRGITHEWVRHRIGAYTQESTRFVNYEKKMPPSFISPFLVEEYKEGEYSDRIVNAFKAWQEAIGKCEDTYKEIIKCGLPPQIARSVFPNALASRLITTYNLRNWRHFFLMRTSREAHPQMRQVTIPLLSEFKEKIPLLYDDIEPLGKQSENLKRMR